MLRRRYLVAYDVRHPQRLRRVSKKMEGFGDRTQYSIFLCDLTRADVGDMKHALDGLIDSTLDRVLIIDLGYPGDQKFEFLGRRHKLPTIGPRVL
jgi:CRISPR-associated protein Cas2